MMISVSRSRAESSLYIYITVKLPLYVKCIYTHCRLNESSTFLPISIVLSLSSLNLFLAAT